MSFSLQPKTAPLFWEQIICFWLLIAGSVYAQEATPPPNIGSTHEQQIRVAALLTDAEKAWLQEHPVIRLGIDRDFAPYEWIDEKGRYVGLTADYIKLVEQRLGVRFAIIKDKSWAQIMEMARQGQLDMVSDAVRTKEREKFLIFTEPFVRNPVIIIDDGRAGFVGSLARLVGKRVAIEKGYFTQELVANNYPAIQIVDAKNVYDALRMIAERQVDAYIGDAAAATYAIKQAGWLNLRFSGQAGYYSEHSMAVVQAYPLLASSVAKALATIQPIERDRILNRWMSLKASEGIRTELVLQYGAVALLLILLIGYWNFRLRREIRLRAALQAELRIAATAFQSRESIFITDAQGVIMRVNRAFIDLTGYTPEEAVGQTPRLFRSGHHDASFYAALWESVLHAGFWQGEIWNRRKNGEAYLDWLTITAVKDDRGAITHFVGAQADITQRKVAEQEIKQLAFYDPLTHLPNRRLLRDRLQQAMASSSRSSHHGALLFIDMDNFKTLNDTVGHDVGDMLLQEVAERLVRCVREDDTVARLGGDEFVVLLEGLSEIPRMAAAQAETVGEKILAALGQPYRLVTQEYRGTASIGVALFIEHQSSIDELLKQADLSMYQAKAAGRNTLRFFDPKMQAVISNRVALEADLHEAIRHQQFFLVYQAQVNSAGRLIGAEALVRWRHPQRGQVSPADFIPLAEETGLILSLGHWVLDAACQQLAAWAHCPDRVHATLAVNVSARQFRHPEFVAQALATLERHSANPQQLKLELTESLLLDDMEDTIAKMTALKAKGVGFSLDDFGTGYSSLAYLKRLPLDQLKIDQSFVRDILIDPNDAAIAQTIVALAQSLGLAVIAEGVETEAQRDFLMHSGCHAFQGYFYGRPGPVEALESFSSKWEAH